MIHCSFIFPNTDTMINKYKNILFGFLHGVRNASKIVDQDVSSLIFTSDELPDGLVFLTDPLLFFAAGTIFFGAVFGLLPLPILKELFKPPIPVATGFFALQLKSREVIADDGMGANADPCTTSTISANIKTKLLLDGVISTSKTASFNTCILRTLFVGSERERRGNSLYLLIELRHPALRYAQYMATVQY